MGPTRPAEMRRYDKRGEQPIVATVANSEAKDILMELEHNLERLTSNILETRKDDIPALIRDM